MIYLASSADEAKIWDAPTFTLLEQFNPYDEPVTDVSWSHDGNSIACCCSLDKTVHLRLTKTTHSVPSDSFVLPANCQCLDYNSSSRFLLCGCVDGSVHFWDRRTKTIKKSYTKHKHPVTVARWNWNDTYIALGSENGEILLYNVVTGQASSPLVASTVQPIRQLKYNPYRKASLVSVSDGGIVNFWDTNTRRLVHAFTNTHQAPAKDLAFSPINDCLMVSVGLDKRAVFYDIQNKSAIKTLVAEHPLTSVDMMQDGATVVVGTTRGKVLFYDMRQASTPVFDLSAHKSSVRHLSFVRKDDGKGDSLSSQSLRRQLPVAPVSSTDALNQNSNNSSYHSPRNNAYSAGLDAFSPLGELHRTGSSPTDKTGSEKSWMYNLNKSLGGDVATTGGEGVFSPLRHDHSQSLNSTHGTSSLIGNNSFLTQILGSAENSTNKDPSQSLSNKVTTTEDKFEDRNHPPSKGDSTPTSNAGHSDSPPRLLQQRDIRASPSLQKLTSPRVEDVTSSPLHHRTSPTRSKTSPLRHTTSSFTRSPPRHGVSFEDKPEILGDDRVNGSAASFSPRETRSDNARITDFVDLRNRPNAQSPQRESTPPSMASAAANASSSLPSSTSLRQLVRDLLREQLQEHQEHLKSDIRAMLGHPVISHASSVSQQLSSTSQSMQASPGMFQAEFIRNLIQEELEDVKDFIHKEFWCVQVELIKQVFQLQKQMEAGFAECMINPVLLDEIQRLREENARLKKTF